ncbi:MAG: hypothetical protein M4579_003885 [Chaenotheca gracillima]|nr:MAG: hypothetical protein M4579_003885 [Chaenotheca gracillima]
MEVEPQEQAATEPLFRPTKRRKFYRQRPGEPSEEEDRVATQSQRATATHAPRNVGGSSFETSEAADHDDEGDARGAGLSMADILRFRKMARHRNSGIEFTNSSAPKGRSGAAYNRAMIPSSSTGDGVEGGENEEIPEALSAVVNRFAPQTGQVSTDVNKHMMEYIETELARRRRETQDAQQVASGRGDHDGGDAEELERLVMDSNEHGNTAHDSHERQPAAMGRLHEIDLGPDAMMRNIARTKAATSSGVEGGEGDLEAEEGAQNTRVGGKKKKGSKPWRKRRTSEDIKRDQLVEEVLRESRLEIYDEPEPANEEEDEQAADDRIADQFRREFMDAVSSRQRRRANMASSSKAQNGVKKDERPKGPKLGGSRSARAAMREQQEKGKR